MNEYMARMFGNLPQPTLEEALEKTASIQLIQSLAAERGVDITNYDFNALSVPELHEVINLTTVGEPEKTASAEPAPAEGDELQKIAAQAKFLGEGMAHAFYAKSRELAAQDVQKTASAQPAPNTAFETLAQLRAQEWLEKQASAQPQNQPTFDDYVNARAAEILRAQGVAV